MASVYKRNVLRMFKKGLTLSDPVSSLRDIIILRETYYYIYYNTCDDVLYFIINYILSLKEKY
jgi:hypothetical protein